MLDIEVKVLDERTRAWGLPNYQTDMAAALDLHACIDAPLTIAPGQTVLIPTGIALFINRPDVVALIYPRSGLGHKKGLVLGNGTGVLDGDYTGPVLVSAWNRTQRHLRWWKNTPVVIKPGERMAQIVFAPIFRATLTEVASFTRQSQRGEDGFGSTGTHTPPAP